jgi:hypothetical protein
MNDRVSSKVLIGQFTPIKKNVFFLEMRKVIELTPLRD